MDTSTNEVVSDDEIERVHAYASFGDMDKRDVVDEGVVKYAFGFVTGYTQLQILQEHGLVRASRSYHSTLTKKGQRYLRAMFDRPIVPVILKLRRQ